MIASFRTEIAFAVAVHSRHLFKKMNGETAPDLNRWWSDTCNRKNVRNISLAVDRQLEKLRFWRYCNKVQEKSVGKRRSGFCVQWTTTVNALEEMSVE